MPELTLLRPIKTEERKSSITVIKRRTYEYVENGHKKKRVRVTETPLYKLLQCEQIERSPRVYTHIKRMVK